MVLVDALINQINKNAGKAIEGLATTQFNISFGKATETNLLPLKALLEQRVSLLSQSLRSYNFLVRESAVSAVTIGRRQQDIIREITLKQLQKGLIGGDSTFFVKDTLAQKLINKGIFTTTTGQPVTLGTGKEELFKLRNVFFNNVPMFRQDGKLKFMLLNKNNEFMAFDVDHYSELVAITTTTEAREVSTEERARVQGTRFVKFNDTGKSKSSYFKEGDIQCGNINGQTFSIVKEVQRGGKWGAIGKSGKFYLHTSEVITSGFINPHPFCKHRRKLVPERFA